MKKTTPWFESVSTYFGTKYVEVCLMEFDNYIQYKTGKSPKIPIELAKIHFTEKHGHFNTRYYWLVFGPKGKRVVAQGSCKSLESAVEKAEKELARRKYTMVGEKFLNLL